MSTTASHSDIARNPTDLYDILILRSPTRCATCHERIRDKHDLPDDQSHDGVGTGNRPDAVLERAGVGEIGHDFEAKDDYGAARHYHSKTYCGECGRPAGRTPGDPTSLDMMLDRIPALLACLDANGCAYDADTVYTVVRSLKGSDEYDNRDTDIWRTATALAVEKA
jgi:hypothetical protein